MIDLGEAKHIDNLIIKYIQAILAESEIPNTGDPKESTKKSTTETIKKGSALRAAIFDPLLSAIESSRTVYLSPDSELTRLPFESLPMDENDHSYLIDKYEFVYVSSARDVLQFTIRHDGTPTNCIVAVDPDFNLRNDQKARMDEQQSEELGRTVVLSFRTLLKPFNRLLGTRVEGRHISSILHVKPWVYQDVVESKIKAINSPFILHIATHGFFLSGNMRSRHLEIKEGEKIEIPYFDPMNYSGLALAGANTPMPSSSIGVLECPKD